MGNYRDKWKVRRGRLSQKLRRLYEDTEGTEANWALVASHLIKRLGTDSFMKAYSGTAAVHKFQVQLLMDDREGENLWRWYEVAELIERGLFADARLLILDSLVELDSRLEERGELQRRAGDWIVTSERRCPDCNSIMEQKSRIDYRCQPCDQNARDRALTGRYQIDHGLTNAIFATSVNTFIDAATRPLWHNGDPDE